jgi:hypothetical protein
MEARPLPSLLLHYTNERLETKKLRGIFRSFAWDKGGDALILVGDGGRILKVEEERSVSVGSGTRQNLRGISVNAADGTALIVGNAGSVLLLDQNASVSKAKVSTSQNLRAASWHPDGKLALIAGNGGTLLRYADQRFQIIDGGRANLRHIAWQPNANLALVTSNCFAEEFVPSPNLFNYNAVTQELSACNEGRADLIGVDWKRNGTSALVVGYDVIWHNGMIATYDGSNVSPIEFSNKRVYPVAVSWNRASDLAGIVTATAQLGMGEGSVYLWDGKRLRVIFSNNEFFFSAVAWNGDGSELVALASSVTRTFNC